MTPTKEEEDSEEEIVAGSSISRHKKRKDGEEGSSSLWLITFTDVMALMLTFFVLLYSMSVPKEEEWKEITNGLSNQLAKQFSLEAKKGKQETININKIDFSKAQSLSYLSSVLENVLERDERLKNLKIIPQKDSLVVSIPQELLFESGQAEISPQGKQVLFSLSNALTRIRNRIEIIGHTDPHPIEKAQNFSSNWELSLARAGNVASTLENGGYQKSMLIRGLSSSRYDDLPEEMNETEKLSLARRVDIVIMQDDGSQRSFIDFK